MPCYINRLNKKAAMIKQKKKKTRNVHNFNQFYTMLFNDNNV